MEDFNKWEPENLGQVVFDENFELGLPESQLSMQEFCQDLKEQSFVSNQDVKCWFDDFIKFARTEFPIEDL